jgi:hypothetical protein
MAGSTVSGQVISSDEERFILAQSLCKERQGVTTDIRPLHRERDNKQIVLCSNSITYMCGIWCDNRTNKTQINLLLFRAVAQVKAPTPPAKRARPAQDGGIEPISVWS